MGKVSRRDAEAQSFSWERRRPLRFWSQREYLVIIPLSVARTASIEQFFDFGIIERRFENRYLVHATIQVADRKA
ncbi:MAG: hypothetical protein ACI8XO_004310, partial [Verrucomicrobiales bacterium]